MSTDPTVIMDEPVSQVSEDETVLIAILDTSGSMDSAASSESSTETGGLVFSRIDLVKHSMRCVAGMISMKANASLGIIGFDSAAKKVMATLDMKTHMDTANHAIDELKAGGATNIWDGLRAGLQEAEFVLSNNPSANVHICLLTDGEPTETMLPPTGLRETLRRKLVGPLKNVKVHTFGFGYNLDSKLLYDLCVIGGGMFGYIPDCSMVGSVFINFCSTILKRDNMTITDDAFLSGRDMLVNVLKEIHVDGAGHCPDVGRNPFTQIQSYLAQHSGNAMCEALTTDIDDSDANKGQLMKGLSSYDWFKRWGYNHILAYSRALEVGVCANFKDQALQLFATEEFKELQDKGNELFADLPAPIPRGHSAATFSAYQQQTGFTMSLFNTDDGGCFAGDCMVEMADGTHKKVSECVKGDVLDNGSTILCVIRKKVGREVKMVRFPGGQEHFSAIESPGRLIGVEDSNRLPLGLLVTPWHPIRATKGMPWMFPCLWMNKVEKVYMEYFYDFIVEGENQWATINGLQVIPLGHGVKDDHVASHEIYGSRDILNTYRKKYPEGWDKGFIEE